MERLWEQHKGIMANSELYADAEEVANEICNVVSIIDEQPQADKWIPVEERLPSENGKYLTTCEGIKIPQIRLYKNGWDSIAEVIAWQPLPQPYKKEGAE